MKKYYVTIAMLVFIGACSSNSTDNKDKDAKDAAPAATAPAADAISSNPDYQKGLALIAASDCLTCHKVNEKLTGPAYREVANKYENNEANVLGADVLGEVDRQPRPVEEK